MSNKLVTEELIVAADPVFCQNLDDSTASTGAIDMSGYEAAVFLINVGATGSVCAVDAKIEEADDPLDEDPWSDVDGLETTTMVGLDEVIVRVEVRESAIAKQYIRMTVETSDGAADICVIALGARPKTGPGVDLISEETKVF